MSGLKSKCCPSVQVIADELSLLVHRQATVQLFILIQEEQKKMCNSHYLYVILSRLRYFVFRDFAFILRRGEDLDGPITKRPSPEIFSSNNLIFIR